MARSSMTSQKGFTLIEVLVAAFILFLALTSSALIYKGALLSSAKAEQSVSISAAAQAIRQLVREDFNDSVGSGVLSGDGQFGDFSFKWR